MERLQSPHRSSSFIKLVRRGEILDGSIAQWHCPHGNLSVCFHIEIPLAGELFVDVTALLRGVLADADVAMEGVSLARLTRRSNLLSASVLPPELRRPSC